MSPAPDPDALASAVGGLLGGSGWRVRPLGGSTERAFLATGPRTVVIRLDTPALVLRQVGRLGVGPSVLAEGRIDGRELVVQEHAAAEPASAAWIVEHPREVAGLVRRYAADQELAALARPLVALSFASDLLAAASAAHLPDADVALAERLSAAAANAGAGAAVASHGDPNSSNFLVGERPMLVDWDDLRRADPMRDLGQLAWWYLPETDWPAFVTAGGVAWEPATRDRLFWWVAAESLDVALRLLPDHADLAQEFLADARAAIGRRPNPRRPSP